MEKKLPRYDVVDEKESEGVLLDLLHLACSELYPEIKRAGSSRCALSIGRLLVGILSKKKS
jgi:hypothetical protein